ncbi:MAG: AraC family transcriptional regulator [Clostridiales bacterium]|nr:AraC family transcriptional regulator [Clostridiales bacterium]
MGYHVLHAKDYLENDTDIFVEKIRYRGANEPHTHDFIEITYVAAGSGIHRIGGSDDPITGGELFILNAQVPHQFLSTSGDPLTVYNIIFEPVAIDRSFKCCSNFVDVAYRYLFHSLYDDKKEYIVLRNVHNSSTERLFHELYAEYQQKEDGYMQVMRLDLTKLLILIFRLYKGDSHQRHNTSIYKKLIVENATNYMKEHCAEIITCEKLAENAYVSSGYFSRIFKEISGMTVIRALQLIRIDKACQLLANTEYSVSEVACAVGILI